MLYFILLDIYLQCEEHGEEELVVFIQSTTRVLEHLICQEVYNVMYSLTIHWRLL